jgi:hypothetical protein
MENAGEPGSENRKSLMMFRQRKRIKENTMYRHHAVLWAAGVISKMQSGFAAYMHHKTQHLPGKTLKLYLGLFILLFMSCSVYITAASLLGKRKEKIPLQTGRIQVPRLIKDTTHSNELSEPLRNRLQHVSTYSDSLHELRDTAIYDSLFQTRPGLRDSLALLQSIYFKKQKLSK